jgi:glycosyltransferase involved in cell wall biosynthesis
MSDRQRWRALSLALTRVGGEPWWWRYINHEDLPFELDYVPIVLRHGRPRTPLSWSFWQMCLHTLRVLHRARRERYTYIFTVECDWTSFLVACVQTVLRLKRPRHVILQFIMREKTDSLKSRVKYAFMKWCFASVALCVCSSRSECDYYAEAFEWPRSKLAFVPFHTNPAFLGKGAGEDCPGYVVSAGRTFRDYRTLIAAFEDSAVPLTIVASKASVGAGPAPANVSMLYELPLDELTALLARSMVVVLALEDRQISIGQSVLLQAMAMGKPVVATRVNGTIDYVDDMQTGILVPPGDAGAIRAAVALLARDPALRRRLGEAALRRVRQEHLPSHYLHGVAQVLDRKFG